MTHALITLGFTFGILLVIPLFLLTVKFLIAVFYKLSDKIDEWEKK